MKSNKIVESLQENCSLFGNSVSEQIKRFLDAELLEENVGGWRAGAGSPG